MKIKAVVFDLDGVITSSSREHFLAWAELSAKLGCTLSADVYDKVKGISRMGSLEIVLADIGMSERFTEAEKFDLAEQKNSIYIDLISRFNEKNLTPGVIELFGLLKKLDIKIALGSVSNNSRMLLGNMKIISCFDYIVDPSAVKNSKPAPDIFLDAVMHFSFDPKECVGVEDAAAGIKAIKSAGMYAVGIGDKCCLSEADIVYEQLKDIDIFYIDEQIRGKNKI